MRKNRNNERATPRRPPPGKDPQFFESGIMRPLRLATVQDLEPTTMGNRVLRNWFDGLEQSLRGDAALAGLLGHGTLIGNAREFFVRRVLRTVLPPAVHVGTGRVIGMDGTLSNQIDVIVYDPQFPVMEIDEGQGLYFAEGVIATIEVKSTLDKEKLFQSLDNCYSVTSIPSKALSTTYSISRSQISIGSNRAFTSSTYIFAFESDTDNYETLGNRVVEWLDKNSLVASHETLPRVIVAGTLLGLTHDEHFQINVTDDELRVAREKYGSQAKFVAGFWSVKNRFGWLLTHLIVCCMQRISADRKIAADDYWPVADYFTEQIDKTTGFRIWHS